MAIVRSEDAERDEALRVYRELLRQLAGLRETNATRWLHLLRFALGWVVNRRPPDEQSVWQQTTLDHQTDILVREEIDKMGKTIAQNWVEEGIKIGVEKGRQEAQKEFIEDIGRKRLGEPGAVAQASLRSITDVARLKLLLARVQEAASWEDLFKDPPSSA